MKFRTFLLGISALLVAACAAYFSVTGLSKLFAGQELQVIVMAGSLELAKLVAAGFIYNYWEKLNKLLKGYLTVAVVVLMFITSVGIYGFLTSAYKETSNKLDVIDKQTEVVELKKSRFEEELTNYDEERTQLNQSINELSKGLANNVIQYKDEEGNIITTTSSATRRVLTNQLEDFKTQRDNVTEKMDVLNDSITSLDLQVLDLTSNNEVANEIGPLRYIADVTGKDMDTVVSWLALFIVLVFDPLAVTLIVAFNAALRIDKGEKDKKRAEESYQVYGEKKDDLPKPVVDDAFFEDDMEELEESIRESQKAQDKEQEPAQDDVERINGVTRAEYEAGEWRQPYSGEPYYYHPWFNWDKYRRWIKDRHAVEYWMKYRGGNVTMLHKYRGNNYPDNFDQKIY